MILKMDYIYVDAAEISRPKFTRFYKRPPSAFVFSFCISMPWIRRKKTIKLSHVFKVYPITYLNICMQNINSNLCEKWMHTQGSYNPKVFTN